MRKHRREVEKAHEEWLEGYKKMEKSARAIIFVVSAVIAVPYWIACKIGEFIDRWLKKRKEKNEIHL